MVGRKRGLTRVPMNQALSQRSTTPAIGQGSNASRHVDIFDALTTHFCSCVDASMFGCSDAFCSSSVDASMFGCFGALMSSFLHPSTRRC